MDPLDGDDDWPLARIRERCVSTGHIWPLGAPLANSVSVGPCYLWLCFCRVGAWEVYRFDPVSGSVCEVDRGLYFAAGPALDRCRREAAGAEILHGVGGRGL